MRRLGKRLLWFIIPLLIFVVTAAFVSRSAMRNGDFYKVAAIVNTLILGHSQTECAINDELIPGTANFSAGGESYFYTYLKMRKLIESNPQVKTVIISFSNNQINEEMNKWIWSDVNMYNSYPKYAFMMERPDYGILLEKNPTEVLKSETKFFKNVASFYIKDGENYLKDRNWGGYLFLKRSKIDSLLDTNYLKENYQKDYSKLSDTNIEYLQKIVAYCNEKGVKLYFIRTPLHPLLPYLKNEMQYQSIKEKYFDDIELLDFRKFQAENSEFGDFDHLNHIGAKRFSLFFNEMLQNGLLESSTKQKDIDAALKSINFKKSHLQ